MGNESYYTGLIFEAHDLSFYFRFLKPNELKRQYGPLVCRKVNKNKMFDLSKVLPFVLDKRSVFDNPPPTPQ